MVDVVFVLLLFFMASAGSQLVPKEISVNLPSGRTLPSHIPTDLPMVIAISSEGNVELNGKTFDSATSKDLPALRAFLKDTIAKFGDRDLVVIRPDPLTRQGRVIEVLDAASFAGVKKLTFG
jgi:biopolymer transport protein ExbD